MTSQPNDLMRIVYFSRNRMVLPDGEIGPEIDRILEVSRRNNARNHVTGALIFNLGVFGQILEGPSQSVEETFERIQMDDRHAEVTLLEIGAIRERSFAEWSMGFVGKSDLRTGSNERPPAAAFDISLLSGPEIYGILHGLMLRNEVRATAA